MSLVNNLSWLFRVYCATITAIIALVGWFNAGAKDLRSVVKRVLEYKRMRKRIHSLRSNPRNESVVTDESGLWSNILDNSTIDPAHNGRVPADSLAHSRNYSLNHYLLSSEKHNDLFDDRSSNHYKVSQRDSPDAHRRDAARQRNESFSIEAILRKLKLDKLSRKANKPLQNGKLHNITSQEHN
jgi:hypothetical protein